MAPDNNVIPFPGGRGGRRDEPVSAEQLADDVADHLMDSASPLAEWAALHGHFDSDRLSSLGIGYPWSGGADPSQLAPKLLKQLPRRACFVVRVDLDGARPAIWRRLRLASDLRLSQLHDIIQTAMGWTDSHLHHFQMGPDTKNFRMAPFLTQFDLEEGEIEGVLESDVRLDQVIAKPGQRLFYEYDFGDSWHHTLKLEKVEPWADGDPLAVCVTGRRACPPEDVGGIHGYGEILDALDGHVDPDQAEWTAELLEWMPDDFDPAAFDVKEVNELLRQDPLPPLEDWRAEITSLVARCAPSVRRKLDRLVTQAITDWCELDDEQVSKATLRYRTLLREVGPGVKLTAAGYLPPRLVESLYGELDIGSEWYGKGNREDQTAPVLTLRQSATGLGLLRKAKGGLSATVAGRRMMDDPRALFSHVAARLPLGREAEQDAGLLALLFAAAGRDFWSERAEAATILSALGWRSASGGDLSIIVWHAADRTTHVLEHLVGRRPNPGTKAAVAKALLRN